jgi:hypothetical protein
MDLCSGNGVAGWWEEGRSICNRLFEELGGSVSFVDEDWSLAISNQKRERRDSDIWVDDTHMRARRARGGNGDESVC